MGKFWCKQCSTFVDESKIERIKHEKSSKHQYALKKQLRDLHLANRQEKRELSLAQEELLKINKELGKPGNKEFNKIQKYQKKKNEPIVINKISESKKESTIDITKWNTVESEVTETPEPSTVALPPARKSKETEADKEINSWNIGGVRTVDLEDDEELPEIVTFKKKKKTIKN